MAPFKSNNAIARELSPLPEALRLRPRHSLPDDSGAITREFSWPDWPAVGATWCARYLIEGEIGYGGSSVVFKAIDQKTSATVAIKVLRPGFGGSEADRFALEIHLLRALIHPHIMPICDHGTVGRTPFYVMPYCGSTTLRDLIKREELAATDAVEIVSDLADAISHLHDAGLVHRDIKPDNVLMNEGRAVLGDFGAAADLYEVACQRITQSGCCPGTPEYMSPEQFWDTEHIGVHSDVYSLACLAYELLTGHTPHGGDDARGVAGRHLTAPIPRISDVCGASFRDADAVFEQALAKERDRRQSTTVEFANELRRAVLRSGCAHDR